MESEASTAECNRYIADMLLEAGAYPKGDDYTDDELEQILTVYFSACSMMVTTQMMAECAATLANDGVNPFTCRRVFTSEHVRLILTAMSQNGMYCASDSWAHEVSLPSKSGVSGGIISVISGRLGICTWSPHLDSSGNSIRGQEFIKQFAAAKHLFRRMRRCKASRHI